MTDATMLLSPALPLLLGAALVVLTRRGAQDLAFLAAPLVALLFVWLVPEGGGKLDWLGLSLRPVASDWIARLFGTAFAGAAAFGALYALDRRNTLERAAVLLYAAAAEGVVFAGDLGSLFLSWEVMAIGSTLVLFANGAEKAGLRYALMHVFGGVLLFCGIVFVAQQPEGLALRAFQANSPGTWLLLAGILFNAGAPPLSAWVADAYPRASWAGSVFLSAFTTKAAVAVLIRLFPGESSLLVFGLLMAVYGLVYALIENDIRRMLSYSIVGQVGFMLVAIGIGTPLAIAAAAAHAFCHILYKSLLMMGAGAVLRASGKTGLAGLGGLAARMPLTAAATIIGGLSLAALPFTAGFVSKSALLASAGEAHAAIAWFALTAVSSGSILYAALKLPYFAFFQPATPSDINPLPLSMKAAMVLLAGLNLLLGIFPALLAHLAPPIASVAVLTPDHLIFQLQLFGVVVICFASLLKILSPSTSVFLDFDWLWRVALVRAANWLLRRAGPLRGSIGAWRELAISRLFKDLSGWPMRLATAGNWRTGDIALAATALLGIVLLIAAL